MRFTPLSDWYFCCCIDAPPKDGSVFLSILNHIDEPENSVFDLSASLSQLTKLSDSMRLYALPQILAKVISDDQKFWEPYRNQQLLKHYFESVCALVHNPSEARGLEELMNALAMKRPNTGQLLVDRIRAYKFNKRELGKEASITEVPYLNMLSFCRETILLSLITAALKIEVENDYIWRLLRDELAVEDEENKRSESRLGRLLNMTSVGSFGRLAFRLSIEIQVELEQDISFMESIKNSEISLLPLQEPDLVSLYFTCLHDEHVEKDYTEEEEKTSESLQTSQSLRDEYLSLKLLTQLSDQMAKPRKKVAFNFLSRIGFYTHTGWEIPDQAQQDLLDFTIIIWQQQLLELSSARYPSETASWLSEDLILPPPKGKRVLLFNSSFATRKLQRLQGKNLLHLVRLHQIPCECSEAMQELSTGAKLVDEENHALIYSPLIPLKYRKKRFQSSSAFEYGNNLISLLRLWGTCIIAARLLMHAPSDSVKERMILPFVVTNGIKQVYRKWFRGVSFSGWLDVLDFEGRKPNDHFLSTPMTTLALLAIDLVSELGKGSYPSVTPNFLTEILVKRAEPSSLDDNTFRRNDTAVFYSVIYPSILFDWIQDAFEAANDRERSARQWIPKVPGIYDIYIKNHKRLPGTNRMHSALVVRFLAGYQKFDVETWHSSGKLIFTSEPSRKLKHRSLLLNPPDDIGPWTEDNRKIWDGQDEKFHDLKQRTYLPYRIIRVIEALTIADSNSHENLIHFFRQELIQCLNEIQQPVDLDRWIRLRLVEFLAFSLGHDWEEEQELLLAVLLEFGGPYTINQLVKTVFEFETVSTSIRISSKADLSIQKQLISGLYSLIQTDFAIESEDPNPNRPSSIHEKNSTEEEVHRWLRIIAYAVYSDPDSNGDIEMLMQKNYATNEDELLRSASLDLKTYPLKESKNGRQFQESYAEIDAAELVTVDIDYEKALLYGQFNKWQNFNKQNGEYSAVAIQLNLVVEKGARYKSVYSCADQGIVTCIHQQKQIDIEEGDRVCLKLLKPPGNEGHLVDPLSVKKATLDQSDGNFKVFECKNWHNFHELPGYVQGRIAEAPPFWLPDYSIFYGEASPEKNNYRVIARRIRKNWVPVYWYLDRLLIDAIAASAESEYIAVCFVDKKAKNNSILVSTGPGRLYQLYADQFDPDHFEEIEAANPGDLFYIRPEISAREIILQAKCKEEKGDVLIDHRNRQWRNAVVHMDLAMQDLETSQWFAHPHGAIVPGFPERLPLEKDLNLEFEIIEVRITNKNPLVSLYTGKVDAIPDLNFSGKMELSEAEYENFYWEKVTLEEGSHLQTGRIVKFALPVFAAESTNHSQFSLLAADFSLSSQPLESFRDKRNELPLVQVEKIEESTYPLNDADTLTLKEELTLPTGEEPIYGVFTGVPSKKGHKVFTFLVLDNGIIKHKSVQLNDPRAFRFIKLQSFFKLTSNNGQVTVELLGRQYICRTLWKIKIGAGKPESGWLISGLGNKLAELMHLEDDGAYHALQSAPGRITLLQTIEPSSDLVYLSAKGEIEKSFNFNKWRQTDRQTWGKLQILKFEGMQGQSVISSIAISDYPERARLLSQIVYECESLRSTSNTPGNYLIIRSKPVLVIPKPLGIKKKPKNLAVKDVVEKTNFDSHDTSSRRVDLDQLRTEKFESYWSVQEKDKEPIQIRIVRDDWHNAQLLEMEIPENLKVWYQKGLTREWKTEVMVLWTERFFVPFARSEYLGKRKKEVIVDAQLYSNGNHINASLIRNAPYSLERYSREILGRSFINKARNLENRMFFVRTYCPAKERHYEFNRITEEGEAHLLFEFGAGKFLSVSKDRVLYKENAMKTDYSLFYGDSVKRIKILERRGGLYLSIELKIQSFATKLYDQAKRYRMAHTLFLDSKDRIKRVGSYNPNKDYQFTEFSLHNTRISEDDVELLREQRSLTDDPTVDLVVYAEIDTRIFELSEGQEVVYRVLDTGRKGIIAGSKPMESGTLLFTRAGDIKKHSNNFFLELFPMVSALNEENGLAKPWEISARHFSANPQYLADIYYKERDESSEKSVENLKNNLLLAEFIPDENGDVYPRLVPRGTETGKMASVGLPKRPPWILEGYLQQFGEDGITGILVEWRSDYSVIELRPGVFVRLSSYFIEHQDWMYGRDVIIIRRGKAENRYRIYTLIPGPLKFFEQARPVFYFPTNLVVGKYKEDLSKILKEDQFWARKSTYTIRDFPRFLPVNFHKQKAHQHAKGLKYSNALGYVHYIKDKKGNGHRLILKESELYKIGVNTNNHNFGFLNFEKLATRGDARIFPKLKEPYKILWTDLTAAEGSVKSLQRKIEKMRFYFHDEYLKTLKKDGQSWDKKRIPLHDLKLSDFPLVFEKKNKSYRLRYSKEQMYDYGLSAWSIVQFLKFKKKKTAWFTVAGFIWNGKGKGNPIGLWLEIAPGRVVEVLGDFLTDNYGSDYNTFNFRTFSVGDIVGLQLQESDSVETFSYRLKIVKWSSSHRVALGDEAILCISETNTRDISTTFGAGYYKIQLPYLEDNHKPESIILLSKNNKIRSFTRSYPNKGTTVFLTRSSEGKLTIHGFPNLGVIFLREEKNKIEPFLFDALQETEDPAEALRPYLDVLGGYLPVTVVDFRIDGPVYVNRSDQYAYSGLRNPKLTARGYVIGLIGKENILLSFSSSLIQLPVQQIIKGVSQEIASACINLMNTSKWTLDVRYVKHCGWQAGSRSIESLEPKVRFIGTVADEHFNIQGFLVRTIVESTLEFIPWQQFSWIDFGVLPQSPELIKVLDDTLRNSIFKVYINQKDNKYQVSRIHTSSARSEFQSISLRQQIKAIKVGAFPFKLEGDKVYLALSSVAGIPFLLLNSRDIKRNTVIASVFRKVISNNSFILEAAGGGLRYRFDLPPLYFNHSQYEWLPKAWSINLEIEDKNTDDPNYQLILQLRQIYEIISPNQETFTLREELIDEFSELLQTIMHQQFTSLFASLSALLVGIDLFNRLQESDHQDRADYLAKSLLDLVRKTGNRALRSQHIEVLINKWLSDPTRYQEVNHTGLWRRFHLLGTFLFRDMEQKTYSFYKESERRQVKQLINTAIKLRPNAPELMPITDALRAALGDEVDGQRLIAAAPVSQQLVRLGRRYQEVPEISPTDQIKLFDLQAIIDLHLAILQGALPDIVLMDDLSPI